MRGKNQLQSVALTSLWERVVKSLGMRHGHDWGVMSDSGTCRQLALSLVESAERAKTSDTGAAASELVCGHLFAFFWGIRVLRSCLYYFAGCCTCEDCAGINGTCNKQRTVNRAPVCPVLYFRRFISLGPRFLKRVWSQRNRNVMRSILYCAVSQRDSSDAVLQAAAQLLVANRSLQLQRVEHEQVRLLDCV